jgi:hypothetical protein
MNNVKGDRLMSAEYFPDQIPSNELKSRLKKHGIEVEGDNSTGTLVSANGERTILQKNNNGNAVFWATCPSRFAMRLPKSLTEI